MSFSVHIYVCGPSNRFSADFGTHKVPKWANYWTLSSSHVAIIRHDSKNKPKIFKNTFFQGDFKFLSVSHIEYWYRPKHVFSYFLRENMQISSKWCKSTLYTWVWLGPRRKNQQNIVENALKNEKKSFLAKNFFFGLEEKINMSLCIHKNPPEMFKINIFANYFGMVFSGHI